VRAILFDFDGVLVDSEPIRFRAGARALEEIGMALTWERFTRFWLGRTDDAGLRDLLGDRFEAEGKRVAARRNALYEERLDEVSAFEDRLRLIRRPPDGIRLAVATGSRSKEVEHILGHLGLSRHFEVIVTAEDYARAKPAPDPFLAAARRLGVPPASCLVLEDSAAGVAAAHAAGMPVVAVDRGRGAVGLDTATWTVRNLDEVELAPTGEIVVQGTGTG
ncbi:MAG: HAD family phosphatase, partial [candidate division NC10 bacterium]|nr:HAD family phosphatase [candidate division NC10 bacterium]